jgi:histone H3/H4
MTRCIDESQSIAASEYLRLCERSQKSAVKDALNENNVSADFYEALDDEVAGLLKDAARRAEANDRKTVQPRDL